MPSNCTLEADAIDPTRELAEFTAAASAKGCGAVASFTGIARPASKSGAAIDAMFLDHHPVLTLSSMEDIAAAAMDRFEVQSLRIIHRCGMVLPHHPIVFVAAASHHRRAAFDINDYLMDRLKTDAVFWKREDSAGGSEWITPTAADYAAREDWDGR